MSAARDPEMWPVQLRTSVFHLFNLNLNSPTWRVASLCDSAVLDASSLTKPEQHRTHQKVDTHTRHVSTTRFWRFSRFQGMGSISSPRPSVTPSFHPWRHKSPGSKKWLPQDARPNLRPPHPTPSRGRPSQATKHSF